MRIISGKYKGKVIHPGNGFNARPTTDFAKESLFNVISNYIDFESVDVLDLFSGTGGISYEFASRGALKVDAVEVNSKHASFIIKMAQELNFSQLKVYRMNTFQYLKVAKTKYDIVFADPPYDLPEVKLLPELFLSLDLLKPEGIFILEHSRSYSFEADNHFFDHRNYGNVHFSFFKR